jgi:hypothetical protein
MTLQLSGAFALHGDLGKFVSAYEVATDAAQEGEIRIFPSEMLMPDACCTVCINYYVRSNVGALVFADDVDESGRKLPFVYTHLGPCQGGGVLGASNGPRTVIPCFDDLHTRATYEIRMVVEGFKDDFAGTLPAFRSDADDCQLRFVAAGVFSKTDGVYRTHTAILAHSFGFVLGPLAVLERPASMLQSETAFGGVYYLCPPQLSSLALTLCVRGRKMLRFLLSKTATYTPCSHVHVFLPAKVYASRLMGLTDRAPSSFSVSPLDILPFAGFSCYPAEWLVGTRDWMLEPIFIACKHMQWRLVWSLLEFHLPTGHTFGWFTDFADFSLRVTSRHFENPSKSCWSYDPRLM